LPTKRSVVEAQLEKRIIFGIIEKNLKGFQ